MTPPVARGILAEASAVTQAIEASTAPSTALWGLVVIAVVALLAAGVLLWRIRRRRHRPELVDRLGLPSLAGGPFALPAGPAYGADASVEPAQECAAGPSGPPAWSRWPFAPAATNGERQRSEDIARIMAEGLREIGPEPSCSETNRLAEQMALIIVSELREDHDLGLREGVALTACISDELAYELRQLVRASSWGEASRSPQIGGRGNDSSVGPLRAREV